MIPVVKILFFFPPPYKFKKSPYTQVLYGDSPIVSSKYRHLYQLCYVKLFSTNQNRNLVLLDDPGRVRSQITSVHVVCQIQRFDFACNLVVTREVIVRIPPPLRLNQEPPAESTLHVRPYPGNPDSPDSISIDV